MPDVEYIFARLGLRPNYCGFQQAAYAVSLAVKNPDLLLHVTKCLYPEVALHFHTSAACVERNIRAAVHLAWERNSGLLIRLSENTLEQRPTSSEFLSIMTMYCLSGGKGEEESVRENVTVQP